MSSFIVSSFGASTAEGCNDTECGGFIVRLSELLGDYSCCGYHNYGRGGETTNAMIRRLKRIKFLEDEIIVFTPGINDVPDAGRKRQKGRVHLERHGENIKAIIEEIQRRGNEVIYVSPYPVNFSKIGKDRSQVEEYVRLGLLSALSVPCHVIDLYNDIGVKTYYPHFIDEDGLHFNSLGHKHIAGVIFSYYSKVIFPMRVNYQLGKLESYKLFEQ